MDNGNEFVNNYRKQLLEEAGEELGNLIFNKLH